MKPSDSKNRNILEQQFQRLLKASTDCLYTDPPEMMKKAQEAMEIADQLDSDLGRAQCFRNLGYSFHNQGEFRSALKFFNQSLECYQKISHQHGIAISLHNIGNVYKNLNQPDKALEYHHLALHMRVENDDQKGIAASCNDIGIIFWNQGDTKRALEYYEKALAIWLKNDNKVFIGNSYNNIGLLYRSWGEFDKALEYYNKAVAIRNEVKDLKGLGNSYTNISNVYHNTNHLDDALAMNKKALDLRQQINDRPGMAGSYINLGQVLTDQRMYKEAEMHLKSASAVIGEIGIRQLEYEYLNACARLYQAQRKYKKALQVTQEASDLYSEMIRKEFSDKIARMEVEFETEHKRQENEIFRLRNEELQKEIKHRRQVEAQLKIYQDHLERLVEKRTVEIEEKQAQLAHSGRLTALGEMASGVAHELSQPLTVILATAELVKLSASGRISPEMNLEEDMEAIVEAVDKATMILDTMREFAQVDLLYEQTVNILEPVKKSLIFFEKKFYNHNIEFITHYDPDLPMVTIHPQRFEQIMVNLISNAYFAVEKKKSETPEGYDKQIRLSVCLNSSAPDIEITVEDNGIGMDKQALQDCVKPFYTTRNSEYRTGLGLTIVSTLVREFEGRLMIHSEPMKGSAFRVLVPAAVE